MSLTIHSLSNLHKVFKIDSEYRIETKILFANMDVKLQIQAQSRT